jgi:hypothetical protein
MQSGRWHFLETRREPVFTISPRRPWRSLLPTYLSNRVAVHTQVAEHRCLRDRAFRPEAAARHRRLRARFAPPVLKLWTRWRKRMNTTGRSQGQGLEQTPRTVLRREPFPVHGSSAVASVEPLKRHRCHPALGVYGSYPRWPSGHSGGGQANPQSRTLSDGASLPRCFCRRRLAAICGSSTPSWVVYFS